MIAAYLGDLGSGKTCTMVRHHLHRMRDRVQHQYGFLTTYTNMAGLKFPGMVFLEGFDDLIRVEGGAILLDEAGIWAPAREWNHLPKEMIAMLAQSRKAGLDLLYTAQYFDMTDSLMRNLTPSAYKCFHLKWLRLFVQHEVNPKAKVGKGWEFYFYDPVAFALYETLEKIGNPLTGMGRARGRRLAQLGASSDRATVSALDALLDRESVRIFEQSEKGHFTRDERELRDWLSSIGMYHPRRDLFASFWRHQLKRLRWLKLFGLRLANVPLWTSPSHPWILPPPAEDHNQASDLKQVPMSRLTIPQQDQAIFEYWNPPDYSKLPPTERTIYYLMCSDMTREEVLKLLPENRNQAETIEEAVSDGLNLDDFIQTMAARSEDSHNYV